jgi:hypothetical protein
MIFRISRKGSDLEAVDEAVDDIASRLYGHFSVSRAPQHDRALAGRRARADPVRQCSNAKLRCNAKAKKNRLPEGSRFPLTLRVPKSG